MSTPGDEQLVDLNIRLPESLYLSLQRECEQKRCSADELLGEALLRYLNPINPQRAESLTTLYVSEPVITIVDGLLEGEKTVSQALQHGNFGLGTLNMLDGEVLVYEGQAYHQDADGQCTLLHGDEPTPYMALTTLEASRWNHFNIPSECLSAGPLALPSLEDFIRTRAFRSMNLFYAVRVRGTFPRLRTRAVRKQACPRPLADVAREQVVFDFKDERGELVGFWSPAYMGSSVHVPGFHLHFLSDDHLRGGHLLDCLLSSGEVWVQEIHRTKVDLPFREDFLNKELRLDVSMDVRAAERDPTA